MNYAQALELLGFPPTSSPTPIEIETAFKKAAKKAHPDKGGSEQAFTDIKDAKAHLLDPPIDRQLLIMLGLALGFLVLVFAQPLVLIFPALGWLYFKLDTEEEVKEPIKPTNVEATQFPSEPIEATAQYAPHYRARCHMGTSIPLQSPEKYCSKTLKY